MLAVSLYIVVSSFHKSPVLLLQRNPSTSEAAGPARGARPVGFNKFLLTGPVNRKVWLVLEGEPGRVLRGLGRIHS